MMLPRMLLHRPQRGGLVSRDILVRRFDMFSRREWSGLIEASAACDFQAAGPRRGDDLERRAARAEMLVHLGELSSARQALEGASVAPGSDQTLAMLSDPAKRPPVLRHPIPEEVSRHVPSSPFELDEHRFLRKPPFGTAGSSRRSIGDDSRAFYAFCWTTHPRFQDVSSGFAKNLRKGRSPDPIIAAIRVGRMTALRKPDGGVRGIVCKRCDSPSGRTHHRSAVGKDS